MGQLAKWLPALALAAFALWRPAPLAAQLLDNASLSGRYGLAHLLTTVDPAGNAVNTVSLGGVMTFDGGGGYSLQGQRGEGAGAPESFTTSGTYTVQSNGFLTLSNPLAGGLSINARVGANAEALVGASTEAGPGTFDIFIAVKLAEGVTNATLSGLYTGGSVWFPNGLDLALKTALVTMNAAGEGNFSSVSVIGHSADNNDLNEQQNAAGATYALNGDGTGTASFGNASSLFGGNKSVFVSADGNYLIGHSVEAGGREIFAAIRHLSGSASTQSWNGDYWMAELAINVAGNDYNSSAGALRARGAGVAAISQRVHLPPDPVNFSGVNSFVIDSDSRGFLGAGVGLGVTNVVIGAPEAAAGAAGPAQAGAVANAFAGASVDAVDVESPQYGIFFGVRAPAFSGEGVFVAPLGVLNAASFAPFSYPISGGTLVSIFGQNLANTTDQAEVTPLPTSLQGTSVTVDGVAAPLFFVSPGQINLQVPFATSGASAEIIVNNNGQASNTVTTPVARSSPGIFSQNLSGSGPAIVTHADFSLVTEENPAAPGETVIIFLTGGGPLEPPFPDGTAGPSNPLSVVVDNQLQVLVGSESGALLFQGAAPGFVGLYQFNLTIPSVVVGGAAVPLAIITSDSFTDFVDIAIGL